MDRGRFGKKTDFQCILCNLSLAAFLPFFILKLLNCQVSESDNCSSVATAQIPVPQQRSSIRRNEYVNIPIPPRVSFFSNFLTTVISELQYSVLLLCSACSVHAPPWPPWMRLELAWHVKLSASTCSYNTACRGMLCFFIHALFHCAIA